MNEYDSNRILDLVKNIGYSTSEDIYKADCLILNTCHIREKASEKVYHDIGRVKKSLRNKKKPIVIITGCVAQAEGDEMLKREKYIDAVVGPQSYHHLPSMIKKIETKDERFNSTEFEVIEKFDTLNSLKNTNLKVSSFLTIQEGCDKFCNFCVVPYTRGPEYSRPFEDIKREAVQLVKNGVKEITLLGQNVNAYNDDKFRLSDLIKELDEIDNLLRIRYTTSHPKDMTYDLIDVHRDSKKLMPLIHLPVQSGSTKILQKMNRKHSIENYQEIIKQLINQNDKIKFSSDFIIGYPGETQEDFELTIELIKKVKFINTYSYIYSPRPGTPASLLKNFNIDEAKKRLTYFQKISEQIKMNYRKKLLNTSIKVLFENKIPNQDKYFGRDEYANSVVVKSKINLAGKIFNVKAAKCNYNTIFGDLLLEENEIAA